MILFVELIKNVFNYIFWLFLITLLFVLLDWDICLFDPSNIEIDAAFITVDFLFFLRFFKLELF